MASPGPHGTAHHAHTRRVRARAQPPRQALNQEHFPKKMPLPGYSGHLPHTKSSIETYGTSKWAPKEAIDRSPRAASPRETLHPGIAYNWPVTSGGKLFDDPKIAPTKSIEEITAHHAQIRDSLGIW